MFTLMMIGQLNLPKIAIKMMKDPSNQIKIPTKMMIDQ